MKVLKQEQLSHILGGTGGGEGTSCVSKECRTIDPGTGGSGAGQGGSGGSGGGEGGGG